MVEPSPQILASEEDTTTTYGDLMEKNRSASVYLVSLYDQKGSLTNIMSL